MYKSLYPLLGLFPSIMLLPASSHAQQARLLLSADSPTASVSPRSPERAPLILPDLEFQFRIEASCADELTPASLSLAIADSRRSFDAEQIKSGVLGGFPLRVPASQLAPLVIADFCAAAADESSESSTDMRSQITIPAALSAQASFLCLGENVRSMTYASAPLDVVLVCSDNKAAPADPATE